ncbi:hypothetical protein Ari01nite_52910 [Paractinoplanes rishiriensis]|uniref:DUF5667 domain-containing protein n=1 Tax=Paractinoplanes rishiriensis TaxID=1050105 RepID=A0A919K745_9ACTN|nr:DUF5667 domain-containing protein [Actinoplanes rishiriensis]GIE97826.1 hypothetical protein Ari01nite_52910 [Actinoplanes rishiriensis]
MKFDFLDRRSAERFAELLDETTGGRRHHSHGLTDERLAELVAIGHRLSAAKPGVQVEPEFRVGLRAMLVATAERDGLGRTATAIEAEPETGRASRAGLRASVLGQGGRRIRARGAIVIGVAAGAMAVSGISAASENASPGDALYGVKRSTERAQLAMAGSDVTRGQLSLDFARTRLAEAAAMPGNAGDFAGVLDDMDADTRKGVRLLTTSAVARRDVKPLATVDSFAAQQRQLLTPALGKLSPANRERATASLSLLDDVRQRTDALRAGLGCTPVVANGTDALGPKLRDCTTTAGSNATSRSNGHSGKSTPKVNDDNKDEAKVRPERSAPTVAPDASAGVPDPGLQGASTGPDLAPLGGTPKISVPPTTADTGETGVGGLLGELFGVR